MNTHDCRQIQELLVDYSDGELDDGLAKRVGAHLERCADCQTHLARLNMSLSLAKEVWEESAQAIGDSDVTPVGLGSLNMHRAVRVLATTAAVLLVGLLLTHHYAGKLGKPLANNDQTELLEGLHQHEVATTEERDVIDHDTKGAEKDVLTLINRVELRARLQGSLELLEQSPCLNSYAEDAKRYLAANYGDLKNFETYEKYMGVIERRTQEER